MPGHDDLIRSKGLSMPATAIDSAVFRDIFSTEAMRRVFSDENRIQKYLDFEAGLARAQARLGIIPQNACDEIVKHCRVEELDIAKVKTQTERIGYPVLPVVQQLVGLCRDGLGEWCHWGATTQDITDSATIMQIREGLALVEQEIDGISDALAGLAKKYRDTPMAGRSNLQQAVPITFGYKMATILAAFERHKQRLAELEEGYEPFHEGRGSSSTMPQKRNPISSVYITALTSVVRQHVAALLDAMVEDHERATGPWEIEWIVLPEIFALSAGALAQTRFLLSGLQVDSRKR